MLAYFIWWFCISCYSHYIGKIQTNVSNLLVSEPLYILKKYLEFQRLLFTGVISIKAYYIKNMN